MPKQPAPTLAELLAEEVDLASLTDEALQARRDALTAAIEAANAGDKNADVTKLMAAGVTAVGLIVEDQAERQEAAAAIVAEADAAMAALAALSAPPETEITAADEATPVEGETPAEVAAAEGAEAAPVEAPPAVTEPVVETPPAADVTAAARPPMKRNVTVPASQQPVVTSVREVAGPKIIATGEVRGKAQGTEFESVAEAEHAMFDRWLSLKSSPDNAPHLMATIDWKHMYGPEQTLTTGDPYEVSEKMNAYVTAIRAGRHDGGQALTNLRVASGGVPGPAEPRYGQITFGKADRPLRDALPQFLASRGEITYNGSPTLADIGLDTALGAIGTVTSAQDAAGATKDIQEISAPTPTTVVVEAETMRWSQGNFADRFYPERTQAFLALGQVAYARHNEALRLADIKAACTKFTDTPAKYGAFRDLKRQFLGQTEEMEDLVRDFNVPLVCLMPEYVPAMLAADLISQQPGDNVWGISEEQMRAEMQSWDPSVKFVWLKDSIRGRLSTSPSGQSPRSAGFDADVEWALFPEGAFLFLDGGMLDLGILRDTTSSATNKFQTFFESWEAVAPLISSTLCFWMTSSLCSDGASQIATNIAVCQPQNS